MIGLLPGSGGLALGSIGGLAHGVSLPRLSVVHMRRRRSVLAVLAGVAILLELAAGTGLAYVAVVPVRAVLGDFDGRWLIALAGALLVSFVGYYYAYRGIFRVEGGPGCLTGRCAQWSPRVSADSSLMAEARLTSTRCRPRGRRRVRPRHAWPPWAAWSTASWRSAAAPPRSPCWYPGVASRRDFTIPWAVIPIPGFLAGFWAADRYGGRFRDRAGWRGKLGIFLDSIRIIRVLFTHPLRWGSALCGMALFWAADALATWAGLAMFGVQMNAAALFVGFATGMVFTRRTGPLAGAGVLALILPLTIWVSGAPLAVAVAGVFVYRVLALLLPMPVSLAALPTLRTMAQHPASQLSGADEVNEPALQPTPGNPGIRTPADREARGGQLRHRPRGVRSTPDQPVMHSSTDSW